jgi:hypothetical protein
VKVTGAYVIMRWLETAHFAGTRSVSVKLATWLTVVARADRVRDSFGPMRFPGCNLSVTRLKCHGTRRVPGVPESGDELLDLSSRFRIGDVTSPNLIEH